MIYNKKIIKRYEKDYFILYPILIISIITILILSKDMNFFILSCLFGLGLGLIFHYGKIIYKIYNTNHWIYKNAKILSIEIESVLTKDRWIETELYYPIIHYKFTYQNKTFSSKVFSIIQYDFPFYDNTNNLQTENSYLSEYLRELTIGSTIPIFINPNNPFESVIKRSASKDVLAKFYFLLFIGLLNMLYALYNFYIIV